MMAKKRLKRISKGDKVLVIAGNHRGLSGEVLSIVGDRVIVQGLNVGKKHVKPTRDQPKGSIIEIERPIHRSNVTICTSDNRPIKLKVHTTPEGERQLVYQDNDKQVVYRTIKKKQS